MPSRSTRPGGPGRDSCADADRCIHRVGAPAPVRLVLPSPDTKPELGQPLPLNPVDLVEAAPAGGATKAPGNELVIAPLPLSNPALGSGLGLAVVYTIAGKQSDRKSPPTTLGGGGFYTDERELGGRRRGQAVPEGGPLPGHVRSRDSAS